MRVKAIVFLSLFLALSVALAQTPDPLAGVEKEPLPGPVADFVSPPDPGVLDFIGQPEQIGTTWYDYQHNGSVSRMIAYGSDGSVHCCWTNGLNSGATQRVIYYNKRLSTGTWVYGSTGMQVNVTAYAGYCTLDLDTAGDAVVAYHATPVAGGDYAPFIWNSTGEHALPDMPIGVTELTWPHVCVDVRDYIHVVAATNPTAAIYYTRSEDGGLTWTDWVEVVDWGSGGGVSQTITSDMVTGKVAIGYTRPITTSTYAEDVYYVESLDGTTWNFAAPVNITNFETGGHPMSSSARAYSDVNLLYDGSGNLHAAYTTITYPTFTDGGMVWHWSQATGHRKIAGRFEENAYCVFNEPGAWCTSINKPALGMNAAGTLYAYWEQCTIPGDVSAGGYGNWEAYCSYSTDGGYNWMAPVDVTGTPSPNAPAGQCMSEHWGSLAKVVSEKAHVQYIFDLDAGGIPQTEGTWTLNPVFYQGVPVDSILTMMVIDLEPDTIPDPLPPAGGSFDYTVSVANNGYSTVYFDAWLEIDLPTGGTVEMISRPNLFMPAPGSLVRTLTMYIPGTAPAGEYQATLYIGDYGWNIWAEGSLIFYKSGVDAGTGGQWLCTGWDEMLTENLTIPENQILSNVYPNPFNPTTTIHYNLPVAGKVSLTVCDVSGRRIETLISGWREVGSHDVTFNASHLPSGIYIYQIRAGEHQSTGKMILMK